MLGRFARFAYRIAQTELAVGKNATPSLSSMLDPLTKAVPTPYTNWIHSRRFNPTAEFNTSRRREESVLKFCGHGYFKASRTSPAAL